MTQSQTIGNYKITTVIDTLPGPRDPGQVFQSIPAEAWDPYRSFALDADGMWVTEFKSHLIRSTSKEGPIILVDSGSGPTDDDQGKLLDNLNALGVQAADVDVVVTTHCHGDHIGWNVSYKDGKPELTFPNAKHWVAKNDWDHHTQEANSDPAFDNSVKPLEDLGALKLVDGAETIAPGISIIPMNGHTPGHQNVLIESEGSTGVIIGDLFHNVAQVTEQTWCPVFDWNTDMSTECRQNLLGRAMNEQWIVFAGHLPTGSSIGRVIDDNGTSTWQPV